MRVLLAGFALTLIALALVPTGRTARADAATTVFQVLCLPEINRFEVRKIGGFYEPEGLSDGTVYYLTGKGYALYAPERHVDFSGSPSEIAEGVIENPNYGIHPTRFECRLRAGTIELVVLPEPSQRLHSSVVSDISITLRVAGHVLVDDVPFHLCEDRGPITRLVYEGQGGLVQFYGQFGGFLPDQTSSVDAWDHHSTRTYYFDGRDLNDWNYALQSWRALPGPLSVQDIDYHQQVSDESYNTLIRDCRERGPGAPANRLIAPRTLDER